MYSSISYAIFCSTVRNFDMLYNTQCLEVFIICLERHWGPPVRHLPVPHDLSATDVTRNNSLISHHDHDLDHVVRPRRPDNTDPVMPSVHCL